MDLSVGLQLVASRAQAMRPNPEKPGSMASIATTFQAIQQRIEELQLPQEVVVAVFNTPSSHVVSGTNSAVEKLLQSFKDTGTMARKLNVDQGMRHIPLNATILRISQHFIVLSLHLIFLLLRGGCSKMILNSKVLNYPFIPRLGQNVWWRHLFWIIYIG